MKKIAITVGQFIHRKGFDVLLNAWAKCDKEYELYIIGATPTKEYLDIKEELNCYYQAADLFVFPTREDIWGLVVNEAMANGLPVITTDKCVAGLELIKNGENGYIVPTENQDELAKRINELLSNDWLLENMAKDNLQKIRRYTVENMANVHASILKEYS